MILFIFIKLQVTASELLYLEWWLYVLLVFLFCLFVCFFFLHCQTAFSVSYFADEERIAQGSLGCHVREKCNDFSACAQKQQFCDFGFSSWSCEVYDQMHQWCQKSKPPHFGIKLWIRVWIPKTQIRLFAVFVFFPSDSFSKQNHGLNVLLCQISVGNTC